MPPEWGETCEGVERARKAVGRPYLRVWFRCTGQYLRVYRSADGTRYVATCPACGKSVRFLVGEGGTEQRVFEVLCG